ncbi:ABC transporter ATP-binding protein [Streptomyces sp. SID13726]|uniref:ABC transporter ATP-binding protein n=1 Tax=Streptomyces sp. SID13726 TaxID=2706058 RepID=UPI0013BCD343|nr:ABC transporter ATP-binding protein [Streptomyces sp. SID13726]NEA97994.1 ABC transporter ATP-binding protein [Streptomyces sp. SID13726]
MTTDARTTPNPEPDSGSRTDPSTEPALDTHRPPDPTAPADPHPAEASDRALLPTATPARTRAAVRELLRPHRRLAAAGFGLMVIATAVGLLTQPLLGRIVDVVTEQRPADALTWPVVALAAVGVVQGVTTALGMSLVSRLGETALARLRELFVERALSLPLERLEKAGSGDLNSRVTRDVSRVAEAVRTALPELARSALSIVLTLGALALLDWRFLLAALLAVPVQAHTARWYVRNAVPLYAKERIATGAQQQQLLDSIGGARTVRAYRQQGVHARRVDERSRAAVELTMRGVRLVLRFYSRLHIAEYVGLAAVLVTGFLLVRSGSASVGTATAAALYFLSLFGPVNTALVLLDDAQSATAGLARLVGVVDETPPAVRDAVDEDLAPTAGDPSVTLTGVVHAYVPGRPVLHGVDLEVRPKERVALVGTTGAGKTTLAKLVAGVHRPQEGRVEVGGVEPDESAGTVGLVTQEVHVFAGPLADDLRLARPDASDEELREALAEVDALGWAEALPEGLDTVVGDGGHQLTPDRAQQLALARLLLADPPVVVLDEATAEAGSSGARLLDEAAERALRGRTALVVAHRLSQAAAADRVVVLSDGRVVESGTHEELLTAEGPYAALWLAWSDSRSPGDHHH